MTPSPLFESVLGMKAFTTDAAGKLSPLFGIQGNPQLVIGKLNRNNTMVLDSKSKSYNTFYKHELPPLLGTGQNTLTNGIDSCFQVLEAIY